MENNPDPEVIRQRMAENRLALTDKLEALEQQVLGVATTVTDTVESVTEGMQETVEAVKDTVKDTVENVKDTVEETVETVKETFDLRLQVERHPWIMLGGSVGVGLLLGALLRRRTVERVGQAVEGVRRRFRGPREPAPAAEPATGNGAPKAAGGLTDHLLAPVKEGLTRVKDLALGTLFGTLQKILVQELPQAVEAQVKTFVDDAVNKLKGAVKQDQPPAAPEKPQQGRKKSERQETAFHPETGRPMRPGSW
jgi:ElaB/YqjD/DUF883 family membrane-anchored ribosome-binding protein